jgi:hypothetical protein
MNSTITITGGRMINSSNRIQSKTFFIELSAASARALQKKSDRGGAPREDC